MFGCQLEQEQRAVNHKSVILCTSCLPKFFSTKSWRCTQASYLLIFKKNWTSGSCFSNLSPSWHPSWSGWKVSWFFKETGRCSPTLCVRERAHVCVCAYPPQHQPLWQQWPSPTYEVLASFMLAQQFIGLNILFPQILTAAVPQSDLPQSCAQVAALLWLRNTYLLLCRC